MSKDDPFGFDMSVSTAKKNQTRTKRGMSGAFETSTRNCEHPGCEERGQYRAPKSPDHLEEFLWFCKTHVREYNLKWNFFNSATEKDVAEQQDKDRVWERETKPFGSRDEARAWSRLGVDDPHQVLGENATRNPGKSITGSRTLPPTERRAIEILEAKDHWTKKEVRKAYKALIKVLHPDMNGGNRAHEEQLQEVVWAWEQIKASRHFKS
ncbi:MAG TPA: molecular chaperone DnaJ [Aliiroseovarius sp.]|nr:molecular chaperone DnaJ [Aliiroseovarius sp.]